MKKLYFLLSLIVIGFGAQAQTFTASNVFYSGDPLWFVEGHVTIANTGTTPKDVYVVRTVNNIVPNHTSYFCWAQCYTAQVDTSPDFITLLPGETTDIFRGDLETNSTPGVSQVSYCFYDSNNISDSVCVEFTYPTFVGLSDIPNKNFISKAYPNPASDVANFYVNVEKNSKNAQLKFFNMLGAQVKELNISNAKNSIKVNVSDLKAGIYFYSLWVDGKSSATGKLMISRN
ncbi:MAG: T9SS type A sorting domain-containing protein [Bacteroidota bacterium]|nr:T9SS type A sorting domain-containing protein [Bacteroidota bacterium]